MEIRRELARATAKGQEGKAPAMEIVLVPKVNGMEIVLVPRGSDVRVTVLVRKGNGMEIGLALKVGQADFHRAVPKAAPCLRDFVTAKAHVPTVGLLRKGN